jgi:hypothetical protein
LYINSLNDPARLGSDRAWAVIEDRAPRLLDLPRLDADGWERLLRRLVADFDIDREAVLDLDADVVADHLDAAVRQREELELERARARKGPASSVYLDEAGLAVALRRRRRNDQATLVEFMIGKDSASYLDVAHAIGDPEMTDDAIKKLAYRTSDSAVALRAAVRYSVGGGHVLRSLDED